jgi:hypothetical protein
MTKPNKTATPSNTKTVSSKGKRPTNPIFDVLKNLDEDMVAMLRRTMHEEVGFGLDAFGPEDPVDLFAEYIETCRLGNVDEEEKDELLADLAGELDELKLDSNGGDREAREKLEAIYDLLDKAIEDQALRAIDLMITAKIFSDAGLTVPERLKQAVGDALQARPSDGERVARDQIMSSLFEVADLAEQNPFDVHENLNSLVAGLPREACAGLLSELIAGGKAVIDHAIAGFILHPDADVAQSVSKALAAHAVRTPTASGLIERLVRVRPWLSPSRQPDLDATIRAMRLNALPPVKAELPKVIRCYVSVCDGSGTRSLFVTQRAGAHYQIATVMMKLDGVADSMVLRELPKSAMDDLVRQMKSSVLTSETDLAGVARMLELAIADNFASGKLPPFKLVEVAETLGLGPIRPDHASPLEIITGLLADLPPEETNPTAVARAHDDILNSEFKRQWFEAGQALEDSLYPLKGSKQRIAKLMKDYLPERRSFWARQCAISALAMHGDQKTRHSLWKQLALVGREIASDAPLGQIPLLKQVAEVSVQVFENRL